MGVVKRLEGLAPAAGGHRSDVCPLADGLKLADQRGREVPTGQDREHTVRDPWGQFLRPFVHRLIGDAHRFGGGSSCSSQQFNGF